MSRWLEKRVADIREHMTSDDEASLWTLFFDDPEGEPVMASVINGAVHKMDLELAHRFADITTRVGATAVLFAIIRREGQPQPEDRRLWFDLQCFLRDSSCDVRAFLVVGAKTHWRAPDGQAPAAA